MKYKQPQHHRSRGKATLPAHPHQRPGAEGVGRRLSAMHFSATTPGWPFA